MKTEIVNTIEKYFTLPKTRSRTAQVSSKARENPLNGTRTRFAVKKEVLDIKLEPVDQMDIPEPSNQTDIPDSVSEHTIRPENRVQEIDWGTKAKFKKEEDEENLKRVLHSESPVKKNNPKDRKKRFSCSVCGERFRTTKLRCQHENEVHDREIIVTIDLNNYYCDSCKWKYKTGSGYRRHMEDLHGIDVNLTRGSRPKRNPTIKPDLDNPNNYCASCDYTYSTRKDYRCHLRRVHQIFPETQYKDQTIEPPVYSADNNCTTCERTFKSKATYRRHLKQFHKMKLPDLNSDPNNFDEEKLFCKVCETTFKNYGTFRAHIRVTHRAPHITLIQHPDLKPDMDDPNLYCATCDKTYKRKDSYISHLATHHTDLLPELYIGRKCDKATRKNVVNSQYCSKCRRSFLSKSLYRMHLKKIHDTKLLHTKPDPEDPNHHCAPCNRTYCHKDVYRKHLLDLHSMDLPPLTVGLQIRDKIPIVDVENRYCNVCDKSYTKFFYFTHLSRVHGVDVTPPRIERNEVNRFQNPIIDRENSYCSACDKVYKNRGQYRNHLIRVHGIRPPRESIKLSRTNHDITPDINDVNSYCRSCDRTYVNPGSYRLHLTSIHKMKIKRVKQEGFDDLVNVLISDNDTPAPL